MTTDRKTNFNLFMDTVNTLKHSQGFYSRLSAQIDEMDKLELQELEENLNSLDVQFNDAVDVILFLEN